MRQLETKYYEGSKLIVIPKENYMKMDLSIGVYKCIQILNSLNSINNFLKDENNIGRVLCVGNSTFTGDIEFSFNQLYQIVKYLPEIQQFVKENNKFNDGYFEDTLRNELRDKRIDKFVNSTGYQDNSEDEITDDEFMKKLKKDLS